ncbi:hypothetical protein D9M72_543010 [compost metagenome]
MFGSLLPAVPAAASDNSSIELGTAFSVSSSGNATGIRFYKGPGNTGSHVGSLWNSAGEKIAQVTFTEETATGWQTAIFANPVPLEAGQNYVVSYQAPNGNYAYTSEFFTQSWTNGVFTAPGPNNGVFRYGGGGPVPTNSWNSTNYFVDVVFTPASL